MTSSVGRPTISEDASAILLLCARLGKRSSDTTAPLSTGEYDKVADALRQIDLRPRSLLFGDRTMVANVVERLGGKARENISVDRIARLLERGAQLALALSKWSSHGIWITTRADAEYPARYKQKLTRSAPPVVFGVGPQALLDAGGLAVVGSRDPDPMSVDFTRRIGRWAADAHVQIVSGAARGVDELSMLSCTANGGTALGVVAESLLRQSTRREFRTEILANRLTLISSYDPEAPFTASNAMGRNRWIYALADRGLVIACNQGRGGTWTGAVEALKHGVTVFVKTGNPQRPGNDALLSYGALPVPPDLTALLGHHREPLAGAALSSELPSDIFSSAVPIILAALSEPKTVKELAGTIDLTQGQLKIWLARLAANGEVVKAGARYRIAPRDTHGDHDSAQISLLSGIPV